MNPLTIGQLARRAGVGVETVRFYERTGLLQEPPRRASGYRQYPAESVQRLRFIRRAKELGFSLREIRELLELRVGSEATCSDVQQRVHTKMEEVQAKLYSLRRIKSALERVAATCEAQTPTGPCPILEALARGDGGGSEL